jgi:nucleotide-binding universal stress UspA family protein
MATCSVEAGVRTGIKAGNVLCVTDLSEHAEGSLELALEVADKYGVHLELIHVVDLSRAPSMPDAQMGVRFILESLARKLQIANGTVTATLLFGCPEKAIANRANDSNSALIAFASGSAQSAIARQTLMERIRSRVSCRVVALSCAKLSRRRDPEAGVSADWVRPVGR